MTKKQQIPSLILPPELRTQLRFFEAMKENIEVITGRRNNKIAQINVRQLVAAAAPTKAEYDTLAAYVSIVANTVNALLQRLDE